MNDGALILKADHKPIMRVEIARSFSYKLAAEQHGGARFEMRDFFCSQKAECAFEDAGEVSAALFAFCRTQVLTSVREYINGMKRQKEHAA